MILASLFLWVLSVYLLLGVLFAILFLMLGIEKVDPNMKGASFWVHLLLFPGLTALWIVFLLKWIKA